MSIFNENKMLGSSISSMTMARLLIPKFVDDSFINSSIIYLDVDTIIRKRIPTEVLNSNLNYAIIDYNLSNYSRKKDIINFWIYNFNKNHFSNDLKSDIIPKLYNDSYFNAGVLIINNLGLAKELFNKCINSPIKMDDQTLLNYYNDKNFKVINDTNLNFQLRREKTKKYKRIYHNSFFRIYKTLRY